MGFSLDFNDVFEGKIKDGEYEVVINTCREDATPGGAEFVQFDLIVRNDVDQPYKNSHIFHRVWKSKDTGKYNMKSFNTIGKACQLQNGKTYKSLQELLDDFIHKTARVTVKNETSEYNGKTYENTNVKYWNQSKINGPCNHQFKSKENMTVSELMASGVQITDEDLPF
ncbi:DUF669 domain-containing protein [Neobacillus thermocopriae]|jgi:Protein of unknown function (DUF669)|uniref:DUF669 domain-containing protein n=1 Tax=Neobacillus thermocopriae TaxID=1215031 RepID=UPI002E1C9D05|nr:DUF669 domain-containing protein [Neobacillus thermocopriae]MED3714400.1 DUF669 domain-containing protein [Neobacillus thermocopriae]